MNRMMKEQINNIKLNKFPTVTYNDWTKKAQESLKGRALSALNTTTYEEIDLKPLYTKSDCESLQFDQYPGVGNFTRGIEATGYHQSHWYIAQMINGSNAEEVKFTLSNAMTRGQTAISFQVTTENMANYDDFKTIVNEELLSYPFSINAHEIQIPILYWLKKFIAEENIDGSNIKGWIGMDPIALLLDGKKLTPSIDEFYQYWADNLQEIHTFLPTLKTVLIDSTVIHNSGGNSVQELAYAIAAGVEHIEKLRNAGMDIPTIFNKLIFGFSTGANFFMEIAKLRAARKLWALVADMYGVEENLKKMHIFAQTSCFTMTAYDPYVNLLRSGSEAFAAVVGGIQYLHVQPFDFGNSDMGERLARNTQLILAKEALLTKTVDPSGGSWYVETLTNQLVEKAWELFLKMEEEGGVIASLSSGTLQNEVQNVSQKRWQDASYRKQSIIGTNIYANLKEEIPSFSQESKQTVMNIALPDLSLKSMEDWQQRDGESMEIYSLFYGNIDNQVAPLLKWRLSEPYEKIRIRSDKYLKISGKRPMVGLICVGNVIDFKARADFMTGFLASGGIEAVLSEPCHSSEEILSFINQSNLTHYCICSSNQLYAEKVLSLWEPISTSYSNKSIYIAGNIAPPLLDLLHTSGIKDCIHLKSNNYETLLELLKEMGVNA